MTKGDRDRIRAEIAGRVLAAVIIRDANHNYMCGPNDRHVKEADVYANMLMDRLGLSEASELARIQKEAMKRRGLGEPPLTNPFRSGDVP